MAEDYETWSDELLLAQLEHIWAKQEYYWGLYELSGQVWENSEVSSDVDDLDALNIQESEIGLELETRGYYENPDTGQWYKDETD